MRRIALVAAALLLSACGQAENADVAETSCARSATREVAWSGPQPDVITTHSAGPSCAQAVVTFALRSSSGDPLWVFASTYHDLTTGGRAPEDAPEVTREQMQSFLTSWADVTASRTSALPQWRNDAATLTESAASLSDTRFAYETPFDRETYEMLRTRDLPLICYAAAVESTQCLIIDPASSAPTMIVAYGP